MRRINSFKRIILIILTGILFACEEEEGFIQVFTEDVLYVSNKTVRLTGRVVTLNEPVDLNQHGFLISSNEDLSEPILIDLGERSNPGKFFYEYKDLDPDEDYYFASYIQSGEERVIGDVKAFQTLLPNILYIQPDYGQPGDIITVVCTNISQDVEVFFNDQKVELIGDVRLETLFEVEVPPLESRFANISIEIGDVTYSLDDPFEYQIGKWENIAEIPDVPVYQEGVVINSGNDIVYVMGESEEGIQNRKYYVLDVTNPENGWIEGDFSGEIATGSFSAGSYFGGGSTGQFVFGYFISQQFYRYDESTKSLERLADLPFFVREASAVELNGELYVFGGRNELNEINQNVYRYTPETGQWAIETETTPIPDLPGFVQTPYDFPFVWNGEINVLNIAEKIIYRLTDDWEVNNEFNVRIDQPGFIFPLDQKLHYGFASQTASILEYEPLRDRLLTKNSYPGRIQDEILGYAIIDGIIYFVKEPFVNFEEEIQRTQVWSYDPNSF